MRILAISGSLRAASSNTAALEAAALLAPAGVEMRLFDGLKDLPPFNPDLDAGGAPSSVLSWRAQLRDADGVLISSPEYAHGVPGALKNALDWVVGSGEFAGKPVALINASPRATHAQASLIEILKTLSACVVERGCVAIPLLGRRLSADDIVAEPEIATALRAAVAEFTEAIRSETACHA